MLSKLFKVQEFVEGLHNSSRRFVPILDPGIPVLPGYKPYDEGVEKDIFIRDVTGQPYIGEARRSFQIIVLYGTTWACWQQVTLPAV